MSPAVSRSADAPAFDTDTGSAALLGWHARHARSLPWRDTRDPWAVLVSELMLQQTQVDRVIPRYLAFLEQFPTVEVCAAAPVGDVVITWAGLGYNRRAVNLHRAATMLVTDHGGDVPDRLDALEALPGIGPYTARAVAAFAFEHDVGVVDTNVRRILARTTGRPLRGVELQRLADQRVPVGHGWSWNQAMLDLGATICTARDPRCDDCPIQQRCDWYRAGNPDPDPTRSGDATRARQTRFGGSDREGRGRLVDHLRRGPVAATPEALAIVMGWPEDPARAERVAHGVVADGLATRSGDRLVLP